MTDNTTQADAVPPYSAEAVAVWRANYALDTRTPGDALRWWNETNGGVAPAGAVAALGVALAWLDAVTTDRDARGANSEAKPAAWIIGVETGREDGYLDAMIWQEGEFNIPLYTHPAPNRSGALLADNKSLLARCDALEVDAKRYREWCEKIADVNTRYEDAKGDVSDDAIERLAYERYETLLEFQHWFAGHAAPTIHESGAAS